MEIGPIPALNGLGGPRAARQDAQVPAIFDIDGSAKPGDGVVPHDGRKAAGAEEGEDEPVYDDGDGGYWAGTGLFDSPIEPRVKRISYFA
jgi:hypothetical protein